LTQQLLAFGRRQVFQWRIVAPHQLVASTRGVLERLLGEAIEVHLDVPENAPDIKADPAQLEQVIVNLALNAREAMPTGGRFRIQLDVIDVRGGTEGERPWIQAGQHVRVRVSDTGVGMDAATKARVFEPFFTTKRIGDGSGLGLAMVYGIVKQSGGYVWVESEHERGTTFTLLFPTLATGQTGGGTSDAPVVHETILVIEPDDAVRMLMADSLTQSGYRVLEAGSSLVGGEMLAAYAQRVHLLVTTVERDDEHWTRFIAQATSADPLLKVLLVADAAEVHLDDPVFDGRPILEKPFTQRALASKVRDLLKAGHLSESRT
jgi:CheY-like chemotaxis protein